VVWGGGTGHAVLLWKWWGESSRQPSYILFQLDELLSPGLNRQHRAVGPRWGGSMPRVRPSRIRPISGLKVTYTAESEVITTLVFARIR
jgi:hypothetical protein